MVEILECGAPAQPMHCISIIPIFLKLSGNRTDVFSCINDNKCSGMLPGKNFKRGLE